MGCFSCAGKSRKNGSNKKPDDQIPSSSGISMKDTIKLESLDYFFCHMPSIKLIILD